MIKPASIFSDRMILQREKPIKIWGTCSEDVMITVRLQNQEASVQCHEGRWQVTLPPMEACFQTEMKIFSPQEQLIISEVAIGEVWLAGGQSNMEFYMRYDADRKEAYGNPYVRMFDYPEISYEGQLESGDYSEFGFWRTCDEENLDYFTAVGYYFAMQLEKQYHIPIGIVGCNWGGTPACAWIDPKYLKDNEGKAWLDDYEKSIENLDLGLYRKQFVENPENYRGKPFENKMQDAMMYGMSEEELNQMIQSMFAEGSTFTPPVEGPMSEKRPGGLYETMLKKLAPYTMRGVIWYQGENDDQKADIYHIVLKELIHCWRDLWKEELPFLFVQLAPFQYWMEEGKMLYPTLRKEQEWVAKNVPNTWMTTIMDAGMRHDIHPKKKKPVGERLALLARGHVYGEDILCDAPECTDMIVENGRIVLVFKNAGEGMGIRGEKIQALEIIINGEKLQKWEAEFQQDRIMISHVNIHDTDTVKVEFAETDYCEVNLYSSIGIPVMPFTKIFQNKKEETDEKDNL